MSAPGTERAREEGFAEGFRAANERAGLVGDLMAILDEGAALSAAVERGELTFSEAIDCLCGTHEERT